MSAPHTHATGSGYVAGCAGCQKKLRERRATPRTPRPTPEQRFAAKYAVDESGCWIWMAHIDKGGYGRFTYRGRMRLAHRAAHEMFNGPIPDGHQVDHLCRTTACVNPAHLEAVTGQENVARSHTARGERQGHAVLTETQVRAIKVRLAAGETTVAIAADYGVVRHTIGDIRLGKNWAHV